MTKTKISRQKVLDKAMAEGLTALTGPELKAYSRTNWTFRREGQYGEEAGRLLGWAKAVQDSQTLFETKAEFVETVNRILRKYKTAERNRLVGEAWNRSLSAASRP